jgi:hypothetical protein
MGFFSQFSSNTKDQNISLLKLLIIVTHGVYQLIRYSSTSYLLAKTVRGGTVAMQMLNGQKGEKIMSQITTALVQQSHFIHRFRINFALSDSNERNGSINKAGYGRRFDLQEHVILSVPVPT